MPEQYREGDEIPVRVLRVMDGDSLRVRDIRSRRNLEVRLEGIDAPEIGQRHSQSSRRYLERLARGQLSLLVTGVDQYGWVLGVLRKARADGRSLNRAMVEAGWAYHYEQYAPRARVLRDAQALARRERRGVWAGGDEPMRPWDYRRYRSRLESRGEWRRFPRRSRGRRRTGGYGLVLRLALALIVFFTVLRLLGELAGP